MAIKYECQDGTKITEATIRQRLSRAYQKKYDGQPYPRCAETGERAEGSSHIISRQRCKQLRKADLIFNPDNFFPATHEVNRRWENGDETLPNYWKYMEFVKEHDPEGYQKRINL